MSAPAPDPRPRGTPAIAAALIELRLMATPRRLVVLLVLAGIPWLIALIIQLTGAVPVPDAGLDDWPARYVYNAYLRAVLPMAALYLGTAPWKDEIDNGTLVYLITRPVGRPAMLLAKLAAAWIVVTGMMLCAIVATAIPLGLLRGSGVGGLLGCALVLPLASAAWMSVAAWCSTITRRSLLLALAIGGVMEFFLANFDAVARTVAIGHHVGSAVHAIAPFDRIDVAYLVNGAPVEAWWAWLVLLGVIATTLTLACLQVRYKEYAPTRSD